MVAADREIPCPHCGYDLRAATAGACPECGAAVDEGALRTAAIPWQNRGGRGAAGAFWQTLRLVALRPNRLAREAARPVDAAAARHFQVAACGIAAAAVVAAAWTWLYQYRVRTLGLGVSPSALYGPPTTMTLAALLADLAVFVTLAAAVFVWLLLGSGVASYFFRPRSLPAALQERAAAVSFYASAPLCGLVVVSAGLLALQSLDALDLPGAINGRLVVRLLQLLTLASAAWTILATWLTPAVLLRTGLGASWPRVLLMLATTALAWPILLAACLLLGPVLVVEAEVLWLMLAGG